MSPLAHGVPEERPPSPRAFVQRLVQEVPSLHDALMLYNTTKQEYQYVGAALQMAEAGVSVVASTALPLAHPLLNHVGGWGTLDTWACRGLDRVEAAAPIITQPTGEVVSRTRALVLGTLAGVGEDMQQFKTQPSTLSAALATRARNTARVVSGTQAGLAVAGVAHRLLDTANTIVDICLPLEKCDHIILDHDDHEGDFGIRVKVLEEKCRRRVKARLCDVLHVNHSQPLDPDDLDITTGHLVELARRLMMDWHAKMREQICASRPVQCAKTGGAMALNCMDTMQSIVLAQAGTVWGLVIERAGRVQGILLSTPAGPMLIACLEVTNEVGKKGKEMARNGVDMVNAILRGSKAMMKVSVLVADGMLRGTVKEMKNWSANTMERVVKRGSMIVSGGVNVTKNAVSGTTQASLNTLALVSNTVQTVVISVVSMGGSVGKRGVNVVRNVWCVNGRIFLRILTTSQKYIPGSKHLLNLSPLFGVPCIEIPVAVHHGTEQYHPKATATDQDREQQQPEATAAYQDKEQQQPETAAPHRSKKHRNPETGAAKATSSRDLQDTSALSESIKDAARCDDTMKLKKRMPELKEEREDGVEEEEDADSDGGQEEFLYL